MTKREAWDAANEAKAVAGAGPLFDRPAPFVSIPSCHPTLGLPPAGILDTSAGASGFAAGLAGSEEAARAWTDAERAAVVRAVETCARSGREFTSDDVWGLLPNVPVTKGLASVLNGAARRGVIRNTGRTATADRGGKHDHGQRLSVWVGC